MTQGGASPATRRDLLVGMLAIAGGTAVMWMAGQIRGMPGQPFSPGFVPSIVGGLAALLGGVLMLRAAIGRAPRIKEDDVEQDAEPSFRLAALWVAGGIAAIALLFEDIGFLPLMILWLTGFQLLLGVRLPAALALAAAMSLGVDQAFTQLLGVPLPPGEWRIALGWL